MDQFTAQDLKAVSNEEKDKLQQGLIDTGLDPVKVQILVLRFAYDMTFEDISKELRLGSAQNTHASYLRAMQYLKEKGYNNG